MADISKIQLPSGDILNIKDETARTLPIASASTLGAVKVGSGLNIDSSTGVLSGIVPDLPTGTGGESQLLFGDGDWHNPQISNISSNGTDTGVALLKDNDLVSYAILPNATTSSAGVMSSSDKTKLNNSYTKQDIIDMFYPIGTIYETLDSTFDPNIAWGGTWEQIEDKFLLAAGSTYAAGGPDGGAASISYTPQGSNADVTLNAAQSGLQAHTHGFTNPTISGGSHNHEPVTWNGNEMSFLTVTKSGASTGYNKIRQPSSGTLTEHLYIWNDTAPGRSGQTKSVAPSMTASDGAVGAVTGGAKDATASHNHTFTGTAATLDNMPPYTIVCIWKRTA